MALARRVEILPVERSLPGHIVFSAAQSSDETLIAEIGTERVCELFCHRRQTDQLMVLRGAVDLVVLENRRLRSIRLREDEATWVRIPPGVPHGTINRGRTPAVMVNAVRRHGPSDPRDYRPRRLSGTLLRQWQALAA
jgi:mannose-6-phosphate isomerase-like protein (cupin superfamily)